MLKRHLALPPGHGAQQAPLLLDMCVCVCIERGPENSTGLIWAISTTTVATHHPGPMVTLPPAKAFSLQLLAVLAPSPEKIRLLGRCSENLLHGRRHAAREQSQGGAISAGSETTSFCLADLLRESPQAGNRQVRLSILRGLHIMPQAHVSRAPVA